jgi:hypothetical protein
VERFDSQIKKRVGLAAKIAREHEDLMRAVISLRLPADIDEGIDPDDILQDFFSSLISKLTAAVSSSPNAGWGGEITCC